MYICHLYYTHTYVCMCIYELAYNMCIICMYVYKYLVVLPYLASLFNKELYSLSRALFSRIQISAATAQTPYLSLYLVL